MRLSIWDSAGSRRLSANGNLPYVHVEGGTKAGPARIVEAVKHQLGMDVALLRICGADLADLESLDEDTAAPAGMSWRWADLSPPSAQRRPWEQPGWLRQTLPAVDRALVGAGLRRTGPATQVRHTSLSGMLLIPTDRHSVWLKAVPPIFAHEGALVTWLAGLAPRSVPTVIAHTRDWWLGAPFPEWSRSPEGDFLVALAQLQIAAAPRVDEVRELGCPERPLSRLPGVVSKIAERPDLLSADERDRLRRAVPALAAQCAELDSLGFPATIAHGDLHPGNVRWTGDGWFLYDWTDTHVTHPFVDLAASLAYDTEAVVARRARAYASVWFELVGADAVERALRAWPAVGAAHLAADYAWISDGLEPFAGEHSGVRAVRHWSERLVASLARPPEPVASARGRHRA